MTHWGWYWKVKKRHRRKALCTWSQFNEIDSFQMFKNKEGMEWVRKSPSKLLFEIFYPYELKATLLENDSLRMDYESGSYKIPVEKKLCNYGGYYRFFHCPNCKKRMRKLYCLKGIYLCRKCAHLGYYSQRVRPSKRCLTMMGEIKDKLKNRGGSLESKPPRMQQHTFKKLKAKYYDYEIKYKKAIYQELVTDYPSLYPLMKEELDWMKSD